MHPSKLRLPAIWPRAVGVLMLAIGSPSAWGQYQDTSSDTARGYPNSRVQSNISDQGSGYNPAPYGPYGQYYSRPLPRPRPVQQRQTLGFPNPGLSLPADESWQAWYRSRQATAGMGVTWSEEDGRLVASELKDESELARAGMRPGDQLVSVDGRPVGSLADWRSAAFKLGQEVPIVVRRDGKLVTLQLKVGGIEELPSFAETGPVRFITAARMIGGRPGEARLGAALEEKVRDRAVVSSVDKGSPADQAGLLPGDIILSLSGYDVSSPEALVRLVSQANAGSTVTLYVERAPTAPEAQSSPKP